MGANEIQTLAQKFADGFDKNDMEAVIKMLADDIEVIDHVSYRFDSKQLFAKYLYDLFGGIGSTSFGFSSRHAAYTTIRYGS